MATYPNIQRALNAYAAQLARVLVLTRQLRAIGFNSWTDTQVEAAIKRTNDYVATFATGKTNDADLDALSDDLDEQQLGNFSKANLFERLKGPGLQTFDVCDKLRDRLIDLIQE